MRTMAVCAGAALILATALPALAQEPVNFGGKGKAWVEQEIGGSTYYDHTRNDPLSKDFLTPAGEKRFTQPGKAEGHAGPQSVIEPYPCPGTQVYPGSNRP